MPLKPTNPRRRQANQRNAQRSTGPRTATGKLIAAQNAVRHRLSVPLPAALLDPLRAQVAALLRASAVPEDQAEDLAVKIIEFERTMAAFRAAEGARMCGLPDLPEATLNAGGWRRLFSPVEGAALAALAQAPRPADPEDRALQSPARFVMAFDARNRRRAATAYDRYLRRARNQFIKALRRLNAS